MPTNLDQLPLPGGKRDRLLSATSAQRAAIQTEGCALLVEAGAGTGKTRVLVERFVHLLGTHPDWPLDSILAITFTNKATREMRSRIRQAIMEEAARSPESTPWRQRLQRLEHLQVSTIHGLCARILRENAIAAGLDPQFDELDEIEAGLLKEQAISQLIASLSGSDSPALSLLASLRVQDLKSELIRLAGQRGITTRLFARLQSPEALLETWRHGLESMRVGLWEDARRENPGIDEALEFLPGVEITEPGDVLAPAVEAAQEGCRWFRSGDLLAALRLWKGISRTGGRQARWGGTDRLKQIKAMLEHLQQAGKHLDQVGCTQEISALDEAAARDLWIWRSIWEALETIYNQLKDARNVLDFDDLEMLTDRLLQQSPRSERLQAFIDGINHLMVDEFQDTNEIQQRIIYALAHPSLPGRLFVVGDAKQSIYRFRQAQVAVLNRTREDIRAATGKPPVTLADSFRTHQGLVAAMNDLFSRVLAPIGPQYEAYEAAPGDLASERAALPGCSIEVMLVPAKVGGETVDSEEARIWEARWIAERLLSLERNQQPVWDRERRLHRPFRFSDAAVLFRATTNLPVYEDQFKAAGLPYVTISGRGYYDRPEINDLLALLTAVYNPADDLSLAAALRSPLFCLSDETLYRLRWQQGGKLQARSPVPYRQALSSPPLTDQGEAVEFAATVMPRLWELARHITVWALLRQALDFTGYEAALELVDGPAGRRRANVEKLLEIARQNSSATLSSFLHLVQNLKAREAREGEAPGGVRESGEVQLLSIHAAKGMEFPVVCIANMGRVRQGPQGSPNLLHDPLFGIACKQRDALGEWQKPAGYRWAEWLDNRMDLAEDKRLFYVACTRAADLLLLSGKANNRDTWLKAALSAWAIPETGEAETVIARQGYSIKIHRPDQPPAPDESISRLRLAHLDQAMQREIPVTLPPTEHLLLQEITTTRINASLFPLTTTPYPLPNGENSRVESPTLISRVLRLALNHWDCLAYPPPELDEFLLRAVQVHQANSPTGFVPVVKRAHRLLDRLIQDPLYPHICQAKYRYTRLPFSSRLNGEPYLDNIDLLLQDGGDDWMIVDWQTDRFDPDGIPSQLEAISGRLERSYGAIKRRSGASPAITVVFLNPVFQKETVTF